MIGKVKLTSKQYVIYDKQSGGYAYDDPIEGWIFSILPDRAEKFNSRGEAEVIRDRHYKDFKKLLVIKEVGK